MQLTLHPDSPHTVVKRGATFPKVFPISSVDEGYTDFWMLFQTIIIYTAAIDAEGFTPLADDAGHDDIKAVWNWFLGQDVAMLQAWGETILAYRSKKKSDYPKFTIV